MPKKQLLVLSHAGVLEVNRAPFQWLAQVADIEVTFIVPQAWRGDLINELRFKRAASDSPIRVVALPCVFPGNGSLFFYRASLRRILRGLNPDHIFLDEEPWSLAALQVARAFPRAEISFFTKQNILKRYPPPFAWIERWMYQRSSHAYVVSDEVANVLRSKGYRKSTRFLPHSYDPLLFKLLGSDIRAKRRAELCEETEGHPRVVLGYFGRLTVEKGIDDLIDAMKKILRSPEGKSAFFFWVGNGPMAEQVRNAVAQAGPRNARYLAAIPHDQVGATLSLCDVLVLPSRTEPAWKEQYGRILIEALAAGAAVAGSDSGEIPHVIRRTGGGIIFNERDPAHQASQLLDLIQETSRMKELAKQGHDYVQKNLTHEAVARWLASDIFKYK